ncbi:hypothetical protein BC829DRAFT_4613 [Chytridium lagenaria]|nr:hypothetical protein BC829DRAFT_4613 [Chytridium lagenaria]
MLHSHQTHDAFFNTGIMAQQMSTMSMSDHASLNQTMASDPSGARLTPLLIPRANPFFLNHNSNNISSSTGLQLPSSGSSGRYPSASSNFDAHSDTGSNISNATLTTALTAGTDFSSSMSASASSQYSDRSSLSASSALSGPGGFIYPSSNPLMSPGDALSNYSANASPFGDQIQQQQGLFLESLRNAATPPGTNMGGSGNTTPTTARRRRALTIPNSQPKTVLKAYMAGGGGHTGLHQAPPTPHPGHVLQGNNAMMDLLHTSNPLSPIPSSPFSAHPLSAGLGSAESSIPPMSARSDHTHAPLSASSATSITLPSGQPVARVPIMPLASSNKNNGPASNPDGSPMTADELFRKLDGELEKINFDDITVSELKEHLRIRALPSSGKKALLVQRLQDEIKFIQKRRDGTLRPEEDPRLPLYNHVLSIHGIQPPLPPPGTTALAMAAAAVYGGAPFNPHLGAPMHLQNPHQQFIMMSAPPSSLVSPLHSPALNMSQALPIGQQQQHAAAYQMAMAKATSAISGPTTFTSSIPNPYAATTTLPTTTTLPSPPSHTSAALPQNPSSPSSPSTHPATSPPSISSSSSPSTPPTTTSTLPHTSSPLTQRRINVARSNVVASQRQRSHSDSRTTRPRLEDLGLDPSSASSLLLANSSSLFIPPPQSKPTTSPTHPQSHFQVVLEPPQALSGLTIINGCIIPLHRLRRPHPHRDRRC